ncbi:hypothetical protein BJ912DRAFT_975413 [Pholiota molesta]|nr:hypothetical protein BJ912DRAFT_975413 [Pholiota molesta]
MSDTPDNTRNKILSEPIGILGAGVAGLINAYVLLQDGFTDITVITRDRSKDGGLWDVTVDDLQSGKSEILNFNRIILCTGVTLSLAAAERHQYRGIVIHSSEFRSRFDDILATVKPKNAEGDVKWNGSCHWSICAKLANEGRRVMNVFDSPDRFIASKSAIPDFIRKSRFLSIISPHRVLRTRAFSTPQKLEVDRQFIWTKLGETSLDAYSIPKDSPFRSPFSLFWGIRTNDEGRVRSGSYYSLVNAGQIEVILARALEYAEDGQSVYLSDATKIPAQVVILATGWQKKTAEELGIGRHAPISTLKGVDDMWNYKTLANPPTAHPENMAQNWVTSVYRGIVPGKNILRRDFAISGAMFASNVGYITEVCAHWTSSYFLSDPMRLPSSPEEAIVDGELSSAWMRRRYPNMLSWINESYSTTLDFWTWPQASDELLEDMHVRSLRSGGNWLTWPFRVIDLGELSTLGEERRAVREARKASL